MAASSRPCSVLAWLLPGVHPHGFFLQGPCVCPPPDLRTSASTAGPDEVARIGVRLGQASSSTRGSSHVPCAGRPGGNGRLDAHTGHGLPESHSRGRIRNTVRREWNRCLTECPCSPLLKNPGALGQDVDFLIKNQLKPQTFPAAVVLSRFCSQGRLCVQPVWFPLTSRARLRSGGAVAPSRLPLPLFPGWDPASVSRGAWGTPEGPLSLGSLLQDRAQVSPLSVGTAPHPVTPCHLNRPLQAPFQMQLLTE